MALAGEPNGGQALEMCLPRRYQRLAIDNSLPGIDPSTMIALEREPKPSHRIDQED